MVTSADSKVKILEGTTVTQNYSGTFHMLSFHSY
jgi:hypothetical protein